MYAPRPANVGGHWSLEGPIAPTAHRRWPMADGWPMIASKFSVQRDHPDPESRADNQPLQLTTHSLSDMMLEPIFPVERPCFIRLHVQGNHPSSEVRDERLLGLAPSPVETPVRWTLRHVRGGLLCECHCSVIHQSVQNRMETDPSWSSVESMPRRWSS